jgi:hypothetical protein
MRDGRPLCPVAEWLHYAPIPDRRRVTKSVAQRRQANVFAGRETGDQGLKIRWAKARGGSSPPPGTGRTPCGVVRSPFSVVSDALRPASPLHGLAEVGNCGTESVRSFFGVSCLQDLSHQGAAHYHTVGRHCCCGGLFRG